MFKILQKTWWRLLGHTEVNLVGEKVFNQRRGPTVYTIYMICSMCRPNASVEHLAVEKILNLLPRCLIYVYRPNMRPVSTHYTPFGGSIRLHRIISWRRGVGWQKQETHYEDVTVKWSSISSSDMGTVVWLYSPWAMSCRASGFFDPLDFLIFARLFWNQIFICASFSPSSLASSWRLRSVRYRFSLNSFLSRDSCSPLNAVLGRFSSGHLSLRFILRERGPAYNKQMQQC